MREFFDCLPLASSTDIITMGKYTGYDLAAPMSFWDASDELRKEIAGGCGPGGIGDLIVPDKILGLDMKAACGIHDWTFVVWNDKAGFHSSNNLFKNNMVRINAQHQGMLWIKRRRLKYIKFYYDMVHNFGESSYYDSHLKYI